MIELHVHSPRTVAVCPHCQTSTKRVHKITQRTIKHMLCDAKIVYLKLTVRDFKCAKCGLFRESIPGIDRKRTSKHYRESMIPKIKDRSFSSVAQEYSVSPNSLVESTKNLIKETGTLWPTEPFALGIDEHSFSGHDLMITVTDVTNHNLLKILNDDRNTTLRKQLQNIPKNTKKSIMAVCIDMNNGYLSVIEKELPDIPIVVDKFHVISHLNKQLQELRLLYTTQSYPLPKKLFEKNKEDLTDLEIIQIKKIFKHYPAIAEFWRMKEIIRAMYHIKNPLKAKERYQSLLDGLEFDPRLRWQKLYRTLKRWGPYILNYFDYRITNAYTEGIHTRIKLLKRISYGFRNRSNYIAKMSIAFLPVSILLETMKSSPYLT